MARRTKVTPVEVPDHEHVYAHKHKRRGGKRLMLMAALGAVAVVMRRKKQRDQLDEGVWHEAPSTG